MSMARSVISNPYSAGGGGGPPVAPGPVIDARTGVIYPTLAAGLAGAPSTVLGPFLVTAAGPGFANLAGLPVQPNDFYKFQIAVVDTLAPSFPNVLKPLDIVAYDAASATLYWGDDTTLVIGDTVSVIRLTVLDVYRTLTEGILTPPGPVQINFQGNRFEGGFDIDGNGLFVEIDNCQTLTNGIVVKRACLRVKNSIVVHRGDVASPILGFAIDANAADENGRLELYDSEFYGRVVSRKPRSHFTAKACKFAGSAVDRMHIPVSLVYADTGQLVKPSQFSCDIDSMFAGAFMHIEDGGTLDLSNVPQVAINANIRQIQSSQDLATNAIPDTGVFFIRAVSSAIIPFGTDFAPGSVIAINFDSQNRESASSVNPFTPVGFAWVNLHDFTGSVYLDSVSISPLIPLISSNSVLAMSHVLVTGQANPMTGTYEIHGGIELDWAGQQILWSMVNYSGDISGGAITIDNPNVVRGGGVIVMHIFWVAQTNPTVTVPNLTHVFGNFQWFFNLDPLGTAIITAGTFTHDGDLFLEGVFVSFSVYNTNITDLAGVWTINGNTYISSDQSDVTGAAIVGFNGGPAIANILTINGLVFWQNFQTGSIVIGLTSEGVLTISGDVIIQNFISTETTFTNLLFGPGVCNVSGAVIFDQGRMNAFQLAIISAGGFFWAPPAHLRIDKVIATGGAMNFTDIGGGPPAGGVIDLAIRLSQIENPIIVDGLIVSDFNVFNSYLPAGFALASAAITFINANVPGSCVLWDTQHFGGIVGVGFFPLLIEVWESFTVPCPAGLPFAECMNINVAGNAIPCVPFGKVEGLTLFAVPPGSFALCIKRGRAITHTHPAVVKGDHLALDNALPATVITAPFTPGQDEGCALEAAAVATFAVNFPLTQVGIL